MYHATRVLHSGLWLSRRQAVVFKFVMLKWELFAHSLLTFLRGKSNADKDKTYVEWGFFLNKTKLLPKLLSSLFENHLLNFFLHHVLPEANC